MVNDYKASADTQYKAKLDQIMNITKVDLVQAGKALIDANGNVEMAILNFYNNQQQPQSGPIPLGPNQSQDLDLQRAMQASLLQNQGSQNIEMLDQDQDLQRAIQQSVQSNQNNQNLYEPPLEERMRKDNQAVGLRNIGNTCYFNSLLQIYYSLPSFVEKIFNLKDVSQYQGSTEVQTKKVQSGLQLIRELKKMFGLIAIGNKSYVDPAPVLNSIVDDDGHKYQIGDERDLSQFNEIFLSRITDAINAIEQPAQDQNHKPQDQMQVDECFSSSFTPGHQQQEVIQDTKVDEVSQLFYIKEVEIKSYTDTQTGQQMQQQTQSHGFNQLLSLQQESDIYSAWEQEHRDVIFDYEPKVGQPRVQANVTSWIEIMPSVLILQLNRSKYDQATGHSEKLLHKVPVLEKIYPQRFLLKNKSEVEQKRVQVDIMRDKLKILNQNLHQFKNYNSSDQNLTQILTLANNYFQEQNKNTFSFTMQQNKFPSINLQNPFALVPQNQANQVAELLTDLIQKTTKQQQELVNQISKLQSEIDLAFSQIEDEEGAYFLHAICVHDGSAQSGHYYTLIKDHHLNIWRKFSDIKVNDISEKEVFEQANGGFGFKTAFWLVYLSREQAQQASLVNLHSQNLNTKYNQFIDFNLKAEIQKINDQLTHEYYEFKDNKLLQQINERYLAMFEELQTLFKQPNESVKKIAHQCSLYTYLWSQEKKDLCKRAILNLAFREVLESSSIPDLQDTESRLWQKLKDQYGSRDTYPKPYLTLTEFDHKEIFASIERQKYLSVYLQIKTVIFRSILEHRYDEATSIVDLVYKCNPGFICDKNKDAKLDLIRDSGRILSLKLCTKLTELLVKISRSEDLETSIFEIVKVVILVKKLQSMQLQDDRHRQVIDLRLQEVMAKNVLQKYQTSFGLIQQAIMSNNIDQLLTMNEFSKYRLTVPENICKLLGDLQQNEVWISWQSLKVENSAVNQYTALFDQFKIQLDVWMKWHMACASSKVPMTDSLKCGTEFEQKIKVSLNDVVL